MVAKIEGGVVVDNFCILIIVYRISYFSGVCIFFVLLKIIFALEVYELGSLGKQIGTEIHLAFVERRQFISMTP
jgi:accessory gene regulator protein AgrB